MDLIEIINTLNNILQPHFYLVDEIYSDIRITNFEKLINANKQYELLEMVKQLNIGKAELCSLSGLGKYLILNLQ